MWALAGTSTSSHRADSSVGVPRLLALPCVALFLKWIG